MNEDLRIIAEILTAIATVRGIEIAVMRLHNRRNRHNPNGADGVKERLRVCESQMGDARTEIARLRTFAHWCANSLHVIAAKLNIDLPESPK